MATTPDNVEYCAPSDAQEVSWILMFDDPDMSTRHFAGEGAEEAARRAWRECSVSWSVYLFHTAKNNTGENID